MDEPGPAVVTLGVPAAVAVFVVCHTLLLVESEQSGNYRRT